MRVELGDWDQMRCWAEPLRFAVFVSEQHVPAEIELDAFDVASVHAVAFDSAGHAVGTGRLLPDGHIGRMAVAPSERGSGIGSAILRALMDEARRRGHSQAVLSAQMHAQDFYRKHGYSVHGDQYDDAGIPHVEMRCPL
ncbi:MAG: GNAT family N-acetyltransferase [Burkholderiaceae bacterium]